ncbi:MAG: TetR/AcrR family transcriptional regulator [Acidimicrobiales bacterium]|nr:TetR/AcrR family transcriptional regulator [Acidimicrobiales bacterium]
MRRLLDAAMKAIDERGYHGTRVQDVVDIANTSHGTFYLYFSNKEDLVRALTVEAASEATKMSRAMTEAGSALELHSWEGLRQWVRGYSILWSRYAPLFRSWTDLAAIDEGIADQIRRMVLAHRDAIAARVAEVDRPHALDPDTAAMAVIALLDRFHFLREFVGEPVDEAALDTVTTVMHRALFAPGGRVSQAEGA